MQNKHILTCFFLSIFCLVSSFLFGQVPTITSFSPTKGDVGSTVVIAGTNFNPVTSNNIVYFGATRASIISASETNLTAIVPSGATYSPISILNLTNQLITYSSSYFNPTYSPHKSAITIGDYAQTKKIQDWHNPQKILSADIDCDGKSDLIIAKKESSSYGETISVLRNTSTNGNIGFENNRITEAYFSNTDMAIGDLDGDGKLDIATIDIEDSILHIYRNRSSIGNIIFEYQKIDVAAFSKGLSQIKIGDIDGDGKLDIVVSFYNTCISIFRNTSLNDSISFANSEDWFVLTYSKDFEIGDINGDNKKDIIVGNHEANAISIFLNNSTIGYLNFQPRYDVIVSKGTGITSIAIGDLNEDGKQDISFEGSEMYSAQIFVLENIGNVDSPQFASPQYISPKLPGYRPDHIRVYDINGDGKPDLVNSTECAFLNKSTNGKIAFGTSISLGGIFSPADITIGDLNGDNRPEISTVDPWNDYAFILQNVIYSNANLINLTTSRGIPHQDESHGFQEFYPVYPYITNHYLTVSDTAKYIKVTPYLFDTSANAQVRINSGVYTSILSGYESSLLLLEKIDTNLIEVLIKAIDNTIKIYSIAITRGQESSVKELYSNAYSNFYFKPNPFKNQVELNYISELKGEMKLVVTDAMGREVLNKTLTSEMGENSFSIVEMNALQAGIYFAYLSSENAFSKAIKLIKE